MPPLLEPSFAFAVASSKYVTVEFLFLEIDRLDIEATIRVNWSIDDHGQHANRLKFRGKKVVGGLFLSRRSRIGSRSMSTEREIMKNVIEVKRKESIRYYRNYQRSFTKFVQVEGFIWCKYSKVGWGVSTRSHPIRL